MQAEAGSEPAFDNDEQPLDQDETPAPPPKGQKTLLQTFGDVVDHKAPVARDAVERTEVTDKKGPKVLSLGTLLRVDAEAAVIDQTGVGGATLDEGAGARVSAELDNFLADDTSEDTPHFEQMEADAGYDLREYWGKKND